MFHNLCVIVLDFDKGRVDQVILNIAKKSPKNLGPIMRTMKHAIK